VCNVATQFFLFFVALLFFACYGILFLSPHSVLFIIDINHDSIHDNMSGIPIIDISSTDKISLYQEWDQAFRSVGCCILIGHGIVDEDFVEMKKEAMSFFAEPLENKMRFNFGSYGNERGGYTPTAGEAVSESSTGNDDHSWPHGNDKQMTQTESESESESEVTPDLVESFILNPQTYQLYSETLPLAAGYFKKCEDLVHHLHTLSSRALGIPEEQEEDYFRKYYVATDKAAMGCGATSFALRLAHYPPIRETDCSMMAAEEQTGRPRVRYGAHTDYMGFTVLRPDERDWSTELEGSAGLEVYDRRSNEWIQVRIPKNIRATALIINAGDLFQRWTNDRWVSPLHRVTAPQPFSPAAMQGRTALVFFSGPMLDTLITVCPACRGDDGGDCKRDDEGKVKTQITGKYEPVVALDYLMSKINPTALNIDK
jgi:isopenicillin N synthase-like dioxygenase